MRELRVLFKLLPAQPPPFGSPARMVKKGPEKPNGSGQRLLARGVRPPGGPAAATCLLVGPAEHIVWE